MSAAGSSLKDVGIALKNETGDVYVNDFGPSYTF